MSFTRSNKYNIVVLLDNIRSALNVGSILRTSDGVGVEKLYFTGITPYPPHPKVVKTAIGAEKSVKSEFIADPLEVIKEYREKNYRIIAIEQTPSSESLFQYEFTDNTLIIFGNEITGVSIKLLDVCDKHIELPMNGVKKSLNVANSAAIVLYHWLYKTNS